MKKQISVSVSNSKKDAMGELVRQIKTKNFKLMSSKEKRSLLNDLASMTKDMIDEQNVAFNQAIDQIDLDHSVSVLRDLELEELILDSINLYKTIMDSYM